MKQHTYLFGEGRWEISGSMIDVAGNPNVMTGFAIVTHGEHWIVDEQLNEAFTHYEIVPPPKGLAATTFTGANGVAGEVNGRLAFFDDLILCQYRSDDGHYSACEALRLVDEDCYEARGALFLDGGHVSSWSLNLHRT